jgi:hypothetical protein
LAAGEVGIFTHRRHPELRIPEHRDRRFRPNVIRDSGIPIAESGDSDR